MELLEVKKLSAGTVYKLIAIGSVVGFLPLGLLAGILGALDFSTVTWNGQPVVGLSAILVAPLVMGFMGLFFTGLFGSVTVLGLWLYSLVKPIKIYYFSEKSS